MSEFVFYAGHGNTEGRLYLYDGDFYLSSKNFGNYTKWAIFHSCLTLNFANLNSIVNAFDGLHAMFGFNSITYGFDRSYRCGFLWTKVCHERSTEAYTEFMRKWANGEPMWNAYKSALYKELYLDGKCPGLEPKTIAAWVLDPNGDLLYLCNESINNVYLLPYPSSSLVGLSVEWGHPEY